MYSQDMVLNAGDVFWVFGDQWKRVRGLKTRYERILMGDDDEFISFEHFEGFIMDLAVHGQHRYVELIRVCLAELSIDFFESLFTGHSLETKEAD